MNFYLRKLNGIKREFRIDTLSHILEHCPVGSRRVLFSKGPNTELTPTMKKHLFWIDLEMTGLDEIRDHVLEVAVMITDLDFNPVAEYDQVVFQPKEVLDAMNAWCVEHHGKSGLTAAVPGGKPIAEVEKDLLELASKFFKPEERIVLVGNSVGNDRRFIDRYLPAFAKRLHYRLVDVSSFKEIYREKYGVKFEKKNSHRALGDIQESIAELKHYLSFVQIPAPVITPAAKA